MITGEAKHFFSYVKHFFASLWPKGSLIRVFKCAKGLFSRLGSAILEKQPEMLKLQQESDWLKVLPWGMMLTVVKV